MADSKITALTAISTVDPTADPLVIVDVSDTSMAASGTTKKSTINQLLGSGGTATLASATITGDLTVRTNKLKVDSTGVAIGATSAAYLLDVRGTDTTNALIAGTTKGIRFVASASTSAIVGVDNTGAASYQPLSIGGSALDFSLSGSPAMTLNSTGLGVGVTPSAGKGCLQLSSGINFPATQVASSDANTLDDYEEGTFTPVVRGSTTSGTGTYTTQFGRYTKVGRLVTVSVTLVWTAHTGTGNLQFAGLPFTSASTASAYDGIAIAYQSNISSAANTVLYGLIEFGSTVVTMTGTPVGGGAYGLVAMDTAGEIAFTATYTV